MLVPRKIRTTVHEALGLGLGRAELCSIPLVLPCSMVLRRVALEQEGPLFCSFRTISRTPVAIQQEHSVVMVQISGGGKESGEIRQY